MENTFDQPNPAFHFLTPEPFKDSLSFSPFHFAASLLSAPASPVDLSALFSTSTIAADAQVDVEATVVAEKGRDVFLDAKVKLAKLLDNVHDELMASKKRQEYQLNVARQKDARIAVKMVKLEIRLAKVLAKYRKLKHGRERLSSKRNAARIKICDHQAGLIDNMNMWTTCQDIAAGSGLFFPPYPVNALASF